MGTDTASARLALLIDADNAHHKYLGPILTEVAKYGVATIRRAFGDWSQPNLAPWRAPMLTHSVQPMQQYRYTSGKNATDSALIIDAMDILHSGVVDGVCIVSSDSDFTRLAARFREQGLLAIGIGEAKKTPEPFRAACSTFIYVENLVADGAKAVAATWKTDANLRRLMTEAVDNASTEDEWAHLGPVGSNLSKLATDFDTRTWGFPKLKDLFAAHPAFDLKLESPGNGKPKQALVRLRPQKTTAKGGQ